MSVQTAYSRAMPVAYEGLPVSGMPKAKESGIAEGAIPFGRVVSLGTDPERQVALGGTAPVGFSMRDLTKEGAALTGAIQYEDEENVSFLSLSGLDGIWVKPINPDVVTAGETVTYDTATGELSNGAVAGTIVALPGNWQWASSQSAADELAKIRKVG